MPSLISPVLADISWTVTFLAALFVVVSIFMMLVILIQKPKGGGLSGAFGGASGGETSFVGAKIGDFLTWLTVGCFIAFLALAMLLTWNINPEQNQAKAETTANTTSSAGAAPLEEAVEEAGEDVAETVEAEIETASDAVDINLETEPAGAPSTQTTSPEAEAPATPE